MMNDTPVTPPPFATRRMYLFDPLPISKMQRLMLVASLRTQAVMVMSSQSERKLGSAMNWLEPSRA